MKIQGIDGLSKLCDYQSGIGILHHELLEYNISQY